MYNPYGGNYTGNVGGNVLTQQRSIGDILNNILSISQSVESKNYEQFMITIFLHLITESISDTHRYDRNIFRQMTYLPNTNDGMTIVVCIEINDQLQTIKHSILRADEALSYNIKSEILDDNHINRMPMITTNRIKLKMDLTIDDFMARLNHFVDEVWEFGAVLYQQLGGNIEAINIELGKFEFSFGGIVVKPLYVNTGEMIFQYSFSRFFCQSLKGDAMYAYVERYKDI